MLNKTMRWLRRNPLEFDAGNGETIADLIFRPLDQRQIEPMVVDLGARNGMMLLPDCYAQRSKLIGFEPNQEEWKKLVTRSTDSRKVGGHLPTFKSEEYHPYAAWSSRESRTFYVTKGAGACTMMGEAVPQTTKSIFMDYSSARRAQSFYELHAEMKRTETVECRSLDEMLDSSQTIDFLKLDVEGAELACLEGARKLLESGKVLFIYTEFVAFPYYAVHPVFGDQHTLLNDAGMRLLNFELHHVTYRRGPRDLPESVDKRLLHAGDAFFALDPDRRHLSEVDKQRLAAIAMSFGFASFALSLLDENGLVPKQDIGRIEKAVRSAVTIDRIKSIWATLPTRIARAIRR